MKPWKTVESDGELVLQERDGEWAIRVRGAQLMSSRAHGSEQTMAQAGLEGLNVPAPHVLIGGLGMGFTLAQTLALLPPTATVTVAELSSAVVRWNRGLLAELSGRALEDPRVKVREEDVGAILRRSPGTFHAILLDVDNGPVALSTPANKSLYSDKGVAWCREALKRRGVLVVWSAGPDEAYLARLSKAGLRAEARKVKAREGGRAEHVLFLGRRP